MFIGASAADCIAPLAGWVDFLASQEQTMAPHLAYLIVMIVAGADEPQGKAYPRPDLLMEAVELAKPQTAEKFRILDVRGKDPYRAGHIPKAVWIDRDVWAKKYANDLDEEGWQTVLGKLGIDQDTPVAIYDDALFKDAARIWWLLRTAGVRDVRLLNGGWKAWKDTGYAIVQDEPKIDPVKARVKYQGDRVADKRFMLEAIKDKKVQIIDARSIEEYQGVDKKAKRGGAIPGARHLEWSDAIDPKTLRFKSAPELTKLLKDARIDPSRPCATYCQSGGRAAAMAFTLELMGGKEVRNYYKSWAEWGNAEDTPIKKD
jgi:thiosulfate/3-mercaptopyruvate sulfurtransferase